MESTWYEFRNDRVCCRYLVRVPERKSIYKAFLTYLGMIGYVEVTRYEFRNEIVFKRPF